MKYVYVLLFALVSTAIFSQSSSDCDCDVTITSSSQSIPNNIANKTLCIQGDFVYSQQINLKNKTILCVSENTILTGSIQSNWNHEKTIINYGEISPVNQAFNNLANANFYNYSLFNADINFNQGDDKLFYNYGVFNTNVTDFRSGSIHNYSGAELNILNSTVFGSNIQLFNEGFIYATQNLMFESNLSIGGNFQVDGNVNFNANNLQLLNVYFNISGDVTLWSNNQIQTHPDNECSEIYFNNINQWHGSIIANHGNLSMSFFPNSNNVSGNVSTEPCTTDTEPTQPETVWLGNNKHFDVASNWSNGLPSSNLDVIIPATSSNPELSSGSFSLNSLKISPNASLNLLNESTLEIYGNVILDGNLNAETSNLRFSGENEIQEVELNTSLNLKSLTLNSGNTLSFSGTRPLNIFYLIDILNNSTLETNGLLTLKCKDLTNNPTQEAFQVGQVGEIEGSIVGKVTVEQCYTGRRAFRMLATSVTTNTSIRQNWQEDANSYLDNPNPGYGTHITGVGSNQDTHNGFDWQPSGNPSMFVFNNANQEWSSIPNTYSILEAGKPYRLMIRGSRSIDLTTDSANPNKTILRSFGDLYQGDFSVSDLTNNAEEFNLVANPYQSVVDLVEVYNDSQNLMPYFIIWDPTLGPRGAFAYINLITLEKSNKQSEISRFLLPQQAGYFVTRDNNSTEIVFKESHKNPTETVPVVLSNNENPHIFANVYSEELYLLNEKSSDGLNIIFSPDGIDEVNDSDALKTNNLDENLARFEEGKLISIEERSLPEAYQNLALYVDAFTTDKYIFELELQNFSNYEVHLKDVYLQESHLLNEGINIIEVNVDSSVNASIAFNRFSIVITPISLSLEGLESTKTSIHVYPNPSTANRIKIETNLPNQKATLSIFNMLGTQIYKNKTKFDERGEVRLNNLGFDSGIYLIEIETENSEIYTTKLIKK